MSPLFMINIQDKLKLDLFNICLKFKLKHFTFGFSYHKLKKSGEMSTCIENNMEGDPWEVLQELSASQTIPPNFNFVTNIFDVYAKVSGEKLALWIEDDGGGESEKWTFEELRKSSIRTALGIKSKINLLNIPQTSSNELTPIFVFLPKVPEYWFILLASLRLGTQFTPATLQLSPKDISYRLQQLRPSIIVTDIPRAWKIEEALKDPELSDQTFIKLFIGTGVGPQGWISLPDIQKHVTEDEINSFQNAVSKVDAPAYVVFTSGTTGQPKMVLHTSGSYAIGNLTSTMQMNIKRHDLHFGVSDPGWVAALFSTFGAWNVGAAIYINKMDRFELDKIIKIIKTRPITSLFAPPTLCRALLQHNDFRPPFNSLRNCSSGGEAIGLNLLKKWKETTGFVLHELYGQTESTFSIGYSEFELKRDDAMGRGIHGYNVSVINKEGEPVPENEVGIIGIRVKPNPPLGLFPGYLNKDGEVYKPRNAFSGDWYLTGDLGRIDGDGYVTYISREDDIIISSSYRIGPSEVEEAINSHPRVLESAVIGVPDEIRGSIIKAFVICRPGENENEEEIIKKSIQNHVKNVTAPYKYPRKIEFVKEIPKTPSGKIFRSKLRN